MNPSAIIFDMDGTLLSTEILCRRAWQQAAREIGLEMPDSLYGELVGRPNHEAIAELALRWGKSFDPIGYASRTAVLYQEIIEREGIALRDGIPELLRVLREREFPLAVATSTVRELALKKLKRCGLAEGFSLVVGGDEVTRGKPHPEIFLLTAQRLRIDPRDCLVFEDSPAGVQSAWAAGMKCILIPDLAQPSAECMALAWRVLESARQAVPLFPQPFGEGPRPSPNAKFPRMPHRGGTPGPARLGITSARIPEPRRF